MAQIDWERMPALARLLNQDSRGEGGMLGWADPDGTPTECYACPFATQSPAQEQDTNFADPGEGSYQCGLIGDPDVWGENPRCTVEQWRTRAVTELEALS